jgi:hypothetical protein
MLAELARMRELRMRADIDSATIVEVDMAGLEELRRLRALIADLAESDEEHEYSRLVEGIWQRSRTELARAIERADEAGAAALDRLLAIRPPEADGAAHDACVEAFAAYLAASAEYRSATSSADGPGVVRAWGRVERCSEVLNAALALDAG